MISGGKYHCIPHSRAISIIICNMIPSIRGIEGHLLENLLICSLYMSLVHIVIIQVFVWTMNQLRPRNGFWSHVRNEGDFGGPAVRIGKTVNTLTATISPVSQSDISNLMTRLDIKHPPSLCFTICGRAMLVRKISVLVTIQSEACNRFPICPPITRLSRCSTQRCSTRCWCLNWFNKHVDLWRSSFSTRWYG